MTGTYQVIYSPEAVEDLRGIYSYIAYTLLAQRTAENLINRIRKEIRSLDVFPERNSLVDWEPWLSMGMRKFPVENYIVFYLAYKEKHIVLVNRIFYSGQDIRHIVQELDEQC